MISQYVLVLFRIRFALLMDSYEPATKVCISDRTRCSPGSNVSAERQSHHSYLHVELVESVLCLICMK